MTATAIGSMPPPKAVSATSSATPPPRYEHYSDFGSATSGKLSGRYAFTDSFAVRATASSGFRAPSLAQQLFQSTATHFIRGIPYDVRTFAVTNPVAIAFDAGALKPEKSFNYSLGFVAQPLDGLSITLDAYQIKINDRIILSENLIGAVVTTLPARSRLSGRHRRPLLHQYDRHAHARRRPSRQLQIRTRPGRADPHRRLQPQQDHDHLDRTESAGAAPG